MQRDRRRERDDDSFTVMSLEENYNKITEANQFLLENIISRLVRLYEYSLVSRQGHHGYAYTPEANVVLSCLE